MQEDSDGAPLVFDYVVGISAGTAYQASVEYRLFILARFPQPPLDKRNGSTLLLYIPSSQEPGTTLSCQTYENIRTYLNRTDFLFSAYG